MIEGLKIDVTSAEIRTMLEDRAQTHRKKVEEYQKKVDTLAAMAQEAGATNSTLSAVGSKLREHRSHAMYFEFAASHVIPGEIYRLSDDDLTRLEVMDRYW